MSLAERSRVWFALQDKERSLPLQTGFGQPGWSMPGTRVQRLQEALRQSCAFSRAEPGHILPGVELSGIWPVLIELCQDIALCFGSAEVASNAMFGFGDAHDAAERLPALLGLQPAAGTAGPAKGRFHNALRDYRLGFSAAWGSTPHDRIFPERDIEHNPHVSTHAAGWHLRHGHQQMSIAILALLAARWDQAGNDQSALLHEVRQSPRLGQACADWLNQHGQKLARHPQLTARPHAMGVTPELPPVRPAQAAESARESQTYSEALGFTDFPYAWLPFASAKEVQALRDQREIGRLSVASNEEYTESLMTRQALPVRYALLLDEAWAIEESIEVADAADESEDDNDE